ncbi:MAG: hypothetical protein HZA53_00200 [Planctomycetes bacterium]|nr:hypothetical protein [Planctomycetota bacterium]
MLSRGGTVRLEDEVEELEELGVEPLEDLKSVCVYGVGEGSVVLLLGNARLEGALERLKERGEYRREEMDGKVLHVFGGDCFVAVLGREGSEERLLVQAGKREAVKLACDVLEGRAASLASREDAKRRFVPAEGSIVFAAANEKLEGLQGLELGSNVVKLAEEVVFDLGESHGELFAKLRVDAKDAKEARQIQQVLQGATALVGLVGGDDPDVGAALSELVGALRFSTEEAKVQAEFRMSTRLLIEHLRALDALGEDAAAAGSRFERKGSSKGGSKGEKK